jgi:hypothetical protein
MKKKELFKFVASHVEAMMSAVEFERRHPLQSKLEALLLDEIKTVILAKVGEATAARLADLVLANARRDLRDKLKDKRNGRSNNNPESEGHA